MNRDTAANMPLTSPVPKKGNRLDGSALVKVMTMMTRTTTSFAMVSTVVVRDEMRPFIISSRMQSTVTAPAMRSMPLEPSASAATMKKSACWWHRIAR